MGRAKVIVSAELRDRLLDGQVWRAGVYLLDDRTYGDGRHYLDVMSDKLEPGFHGVRATIAAGEDIRFAAR